ncbi:MAG: hypothetical protein ACO1SV_08550 [Fimbriimonas sp.]
MSIPSLEQLRKQAKELLRHYRAGDPAARSRIPGKGRVTLADAQFALARELGFESWARLKHHLDPAGAAYTIDGRTLEPTGPADWALLLDAMRAHRVAGLRARGQMTDAVLARLGDLESLTSLDLEGSGAVTDAGLRHLAGMPRLRSLNLTGCSITDDGLAVLRDLPDLRDFRVFHHRGISDAGFAHLASCGRLERVELLGSASGDGTLRALVGKPDLRHFKSGDLVTDRGLPLLAEFPAFRTWTDQTPKMALMEFDAEPNYLLLRGSITDRGMAALAPLEGLFALNLDDSRLTLSREGLKPLAALPNLGWLGFDAKDDTMGAIAELPRLRFLMCQDTTATDAGFQALSRSRTLEYLWGRRCYGLGGAGFRALSGMPSLLGLSVSCRNVDDASLAALPDFPALREWMPMDVPDEGFRHVGRCAGLEAVFCMYCRDTGDVATESLAGLPRLKRYYAGQTRITDRSLALLSGMPTLEELTFWSCGGVTDAGVTALAALPRLRELHLQAMPHVHRRVMAAFPRRVRVTYDP